MRICTPHCGIDPETTSGGETYERELLRSLAGRGVVLDILLARHKRHPEGVPNWVIHRLPIGRGLLWPVSAAVLPPAIHRVYKETRFDLLRAHSLRFIGPGALLARRLYRLPVPIVAHHHHIDPNWLNPLIEGQIMRRVERVVVGSEFSRRQAAADLGVPPEQFSVVPYGVDPSFGPRPKSEALAQRLGLDGSAVAIFLGGLKARKNLSFLLAVWRDVVREREQSRLVVAGSGPLLEPLRRLAARLGIARHVVFAGYVAERDKVDYYNLADALIFPSFMEGFGLTVAEGMSCGLPVIASNRGSLPEVLVDGEGGFLCDPTDREAFVRRTLLVLSDAALGRKFGEANRARVDRLFRWEHCAEGTERVYEDVLERWRRQREA